MFAWIGLALLSASWLLGLEYYHRASWPAWGVVVIGGTALLAQLRGRLPSWRESAVALGLVVPALLLAPWPYRTALVLLAAGLALGALRPLWQRRGESAVAAALVAPAAVLGAGLWLRLTVSGAALAPWLSWTALLTTFVAVPAAMLLIARRLRPGLAAGAGSVLPGLVAAAALCMGLMVLAPGRAAWLYWSSLALTLAGLPLGAVLHLRHFRQQLRASVLPGAAAVILAAGLAVFFVLPVASWAPWFRGVALGAIYGGLPVCAAILVWRAPGRVGNTFLAAGCILLAQAMAITAYEVVTSRSHELPPVLARLVAAVAGLLGNDASGYGTTLPLFSMRETHRLGATWELLLDPVTWCFALGGVVLICWRSRAGAAPGRRWLVALRSAAALLGLVALWLPVRAALLMALYLHDALRVEYEDPVNSIRVLWNPWVHLLLLAGPVLLAWRLVPKPAGAPPGDVSPQPAANRWQRPLAAGLALAAALLVAAGVLWDPVGKRLDGRVVIEECKHRPTKSWEKEIWEPTDRPFDTKWYGHDSGYNFYCIYDYLHHYYDVSRRTVPLDEAGLVNCDVLILKVPTRPYSDEEVDCVRRFVEEGGGLLLIGEHTSVWGSGHHLNAVARPFGFEFRYDCLFGIDSAFDQRYEPPLVPHPILQHVPPMEFAVSCSIDPGGSRGRGVIRAAGLKNRMADYRASNFYPQAHNTAEMRYGAFVQLWSTRYGKGRVVAFTDSTIFSNFCTFEPGKAELMLGMVEWLNHRTALPDPRPWLVALGFLLLGGSVAAAWKWEGGWTVLLGAGLLGAAAAALALKHAHQVAMPTPEPKPQPPMVRVVMDRTLSRARLPKNGFIAGKDDGFGIFERWILRLGYFTARRSGPAVFDGDLVVITYPGMPLSEASLREVDAFRRDLENAQAKPEEARQKLDDFREKLEGSPQELEEVRDALVEYVAAGGKVLVIDSPENWKAIAEKEQRKREQQKDGEEEEQQQATRPPVLDLLEPFGLSLRETLPGGGTLENSHGWSAVPAGAALEVTGGEPFATIGGKPVGATVRHGKGLVAVVGVGSRFTDARMGVTGDVVPDERLKSVYDVVYSLLRWLVEGKPHTESL